MALTTVEQLMPERQHEIHREHYRDYFQHPESRPMGAQLDLYGRRQDGSEFAVEVSLHPIDLPEETLVVASTRDVTERKQRELNWHRLRDQAMHRTQEVEAIINSMKDAVFVDDTEERVVQVNPAARKLFALDVDPQFLHLPARARERRLQIRDLSGNPPFPGQWAVAQLLRGKDLPPDCDMTIKALDGRDVVVNVSCAPLVDDGGRIIGAVVVYRDIALLKEADHLAKSP